MTIENPKVRDHASNGLVESAAHRLRQMSTVLECRSEEKTGVNICSCSLADHPTLTWGGENWLKGAFLNKSLTNDMFVVGHG